MASCDRSCIALAETGAGGARGARSRPRFACSRARCTRRIMIQGQSPLRDLPGTRITAAVESTADMWANRPAVESNARATRGHETPSALSARGAARRWWTPCGRAAAALGAREGDHVVGPRAGRGGRAPSARPPCVSISLTRFSPTLWRFSKGTGRGGCGGWAGLRALMFGQARWLDNTFNDSNLLENCAARDLGAIT